MTNQSPDGDGFEDNSRAEPSSNCGSSCFDIPVNGAETNGEKRAIHRDSNENGLVGREGTPVLRVQQRLGLSDRQWTWLVSLLVFVPYPIFILIGYTYSVNEWVFALGTLAFSLVLIAATFYT